MFSLKTPDIFITNLLYYFHYSFIFLPFFPELNHCLEEMAQAIFKSWFVDFEPFGGKRPTAWTAGFLRDIASEIVCGKTPSTKISEYFGDDMPFITIPDMHGVVYVTSTERSLSKAGSV